MRRTLSAARSPTSICGGPTGCATRSMAISPQATRSASTIPRDNFAGKAPLGSSEGPQHNDGLGSGVLRRLQRQVPPGAFDVGLFSVAATWSTERGAPGGGGCSASPRVSNFFITTEQRSVSGIDNQCFFAHGAVRRISHGGPPPLPVRRQDCALTTDARYLATLSPPPPAPALT